MIDIFAPFFSQEEPATRRQMRAMDNMHVHYNKHEITKTQASEKIANAIRNRRTNSYVVPYGRQDDYFDDRDSFDYVDEWDLF